VTITTLSFKLKRSWVLMGFSLQYFFEQIADLSHGPISACYFRLIRGVRYDIGVSILDYDWQSNGSQAGQVVDIVADKRNLVQRNACLSRELVNHGKLIVAPIDAIDDEFATASLDHGIDFSRNHHNRETQGLQLTDSQPVTAHTTDCFSSVFKNEDGVVCENAVEIKSDQPDVTNDFRERFGV
jgi:hypothetical protein